MNIKKMTIIFYVLFGTRSGTALDCGSWNAVKNISFQFQVDDRILDNGNPLKDNGGVAALHNSATNLDRDTQKCGATLISDRFLLTAAHCLTGTERLIGISLGRKDLSVDPKPGPNTYQIEKSFIHPLYEPGIGSSSYNDIAILQTDRKVTFSQNIWPFCLPEENQSFDDYDTVAISGYGLIDTANKSPTIKTAYVKLVKNTRCTALWRRDQAGADYYDTVLRHSYPNGLTSQVLCAGRDGVDSCNGDSGGPMSNQNTAGENIVIGLIAKGPRCVEYPRYPAFYTNVAYYIGWINAITRLSSPASPTTGAPQTRSPPTRRPVERFTTPAVNVGNNPDIHPFGGSFPRPIVSGGTGVNTGKRSKPVPHPTCSSDGDCTGASICCLDPCLKVDVCKVPHVNQAGEISQCDTPGPISPWRTCKEHITDSCDGWAACTDTLQQLAPRLFGPVGSQLPGSYHNLLLSEDLGQDLERQWDAYWQRQGKKTKNIKIRPRI
ncbi:unnamed protein product [Meganyctiphanes norvegica]|uniref:Peptidase S1 domain-containing protein n=1 Tax=Meganyctiphanes norvegica TaxID=48144 RepID=A0AAV2PW58_MEGNR